VTITLEVRRQVGRSLRGPGPRGRMKEAARNLGRSVRQLQRWKKDPDAPRCRPGRPPRPVREREEARAKVVAWAQQRGRAPSVREANGVLGIPWRLAAEVVRPLRELRAKMAWEAEMARRVSAQVHFRDVVWVQDGAQFGRVDGAPLMAEVVRDPASTKTLAVGVGPATTGEDLAALLQFLKGERGALPLVLCVDNGAAQKSKEVADYCEREGVIVLRNLPRTPQHNPFAERAIGELRAESGLRSDTELRDEAEGIALLQAAWRRLDNRHVRPRHDYRTAAAVDATMAAWYPRLSRAGFYQAARGAIEEAVRGCGDPRARRLAEREAIFRTLEDFGLISRTRGGKPFDRPEPDTIS
jgi:hypothetical protein